MARILVDDARQQLVERRNSRRTSFERAGLGQRSLRQHSCRLLDHGQMLIEKQNAKVLMPRCLRPRLVRDVHDVSRLESPRLIQACRAVDRHSTSTQQFASGFPTQIGLPGSQSREDGFSSEHLINNIVPNVWHVSVRRSAMEGIASAFTESKLRHIGSRFPAGPFPSSINPSIVSGRSNSALMFRTPAPSPDCVLYHDWLRC